MYLLGFRVEGTSWVSVLWFKKASLGNLLFRSTKTGPYPNNSKMQRRKCDFARGVRCAVCRKLEDLKTGLWLARNEGTDPYSSPIMGLGPREEWILLVVLL